MHRVLGAGGRRRKLGVKQWSLQVLLMEPVGRRQPLGPCSATYTRALAWDTLLQRAGFPCAGRLPVPAQRVLVPLTCVGHAPAFCISDPTGEVGVPPLSRKWGVCRGDQLSSDQGQRWPPGQSGRRP